MSARRYLTTRRWRNAQVHSNVRRLCSQLGECSAGIHRRTARTSVVKDGVKRGRLHAQRISASSAWCTHRRKEARLDDRRLAHGVAIRDSGAGVFAGDRLICRFATTRAEVHKTASGSAVLLAYGNTCDARQTREHVRRDLERVRHANWHRAGSGATRNTEAGDRGDVVLEHLAQALRVQQRLTSKTGAGR
jgi:hypothetical protein